MIIKNLQQLKEIIKNEIEPNIIIKGKTPWQFKQNKQLFKQLNIKYENWFHHIQEMIYLVKNYNNLENCHVFCYCGNKNASGGINGYNEYCSLKCCANDPQYQFKCRQKKLNNIDKNGLNSYQRATLKSQQTKQLRHGDPNFVNVDKRKETCKQKYNTDNPWGNKDVIEKIKNTKNKVDKNGLNGYQRGVLKHKENYLKKHNVDSYFKTQEFKNKFKNEEFKNNFLNKQYQTKKKNHTYNKSKKEDECYYLLLQKFNKDDVVRQYKNKLYSFACDFYIKSLDLYIECNFHWTHCPIKDKHKPFKNSVEDLQIIEELKKKNSKYYKIAIDVWTNLDVRKLQTFKKNKLNYKIFYSICQFKKWFNQI